MCTYSTWYLNLCVSKLPDDIRFKPHVFAMFQMNVTLFLTYFIVINNKFWEKKWNSLLKNTESNGKKYDMSL